MANTSILIKRSGSTGRPSSLAAGELAYSYASNTLFIGTSDGTASLNIGGQYYTSTVDAATAANTAGTLVKRDLNNGFYGALYGNANTATTLLNGRNFSISGGDISAGTQAFDGSAAVVLNASLTAVPGLSGGTVGSSTSVPVIEYGANGRILSVSSASISTSFGIAGDTGSGTIAGGETLTINGRDGLTSVAVDANNTILIDVDNTVMRTTGNQTISGNLSVTGNLIVSGNTTTVNAATLNIADPLIYLAANNYSSDIVDIGYVGNYFDGTTQRHAGFFRKHASNTFYAFTNYTPEPDVTVDTTDASYRRAFLDVNIVGGFISGLANTISVVDGGTGASSFTNGAIVVGNGSGALTTLANSSFTATQLGAANTINSVTVDSYGRTTAVSTTPIAIDAAQVTSGKLSIVRGGTNQTSFTAGQRIVFDGTSLSSQANTSTTVTGGLSAANTITSVTVNAYGEVTAYTGAAIAIDASQITSGTLGVTRGGTGASSFTSSGIMYGNGSGALQVTSAAGTSDQTWSNQILTTTNAGVPVWSTTLDGGQF